MDEEDDNHDDESSAAMCLVTFELVLMLSCFYFIFSSTRHVAP
jgi:hypothetical protein